MEGIKENIDKLHRIYLIICLIAFIGASFCQLFLASYIAEYSVWVFADGWQREIGIWNIGIIIMLIYALKANNEDFNKILTITIIIICGAFGTNHLFGMILAQNIQIVNLIFTILNYLALFFGIAIILIKKK